MACGAPVDGFLPPVKAPILSEFPELANDASRIFRIHGEIGVVPFPKNPQSLELLPLDIDELLGIFPAEAPDLRDGEFGFPLAQALVHLMLNG